MEVSAEDIKSGFDAERIKLRSCRRPNAVEVADQQRFHEDRSHVGRDDVLAVGLTVIGRQLRQKLVAGNAGQGIEACLGFDPRSDVQRDVASNCVPAVEVETFVIAAVQRHLGHGKTDRAKSNADLLREHVSNLIVTPTQLLVTLRAAPDINASGETTDPTSIVIPKSKRPSKMPREILRPITIASNFDPRPIRSETCATLIKAIATGRAWLAQLRRKSDYRCSADLTWENCSVRQVNRIINLAFLAPIWCRRPSRDDCPGASASKSSEAVPQTSINNASRLGWRPDSKIYR